MVHKKYIKRNGRIFGPYLYKNYRENGVTKTKYLGKGSEKAQVNLKPVFVIGVVVLVLILAGLFFYDSMDQSTEEGGLFSLNFPNFLNVFDFFKASIGVSVQVIDGQKGYGDGGNGGGGGGGSPTIVANKSCNESWVCEKFLDCRNLVRVFELGEIDSETKKMVEEGCAVFNWSVDFCGVQIRGCQDENYCNTTLLKPRIGKECYYLEEEEPAVFGPISKPDYLLTCLILLILISLLVLLTEYFLRQHFLLKYNRGSIKRKERKLKEYLTFSLLLVVAIILFLISYCWVCAKTYLLVPVIALIMVVLTRRAIQRYRKGYK